MNCSIMAWQCPLRQIPCTREERQGGFHGRVPSCDKLPRSGSETRDFAHRGK
ncbi:MAG: hypothetical protein WCI02_04625 [Planctomycetota bacterium]